MQTLSEQAQASAQAPPVREEPGLAWAHPQGFSRRASGSVSSQGQGATMIVNYLSFIVFLILMAAGWIVLGPGFKEGSLPPIGPALGWFIGSWVLASAIKLAAQWERVLVFRLGKYVRTVGPGVYFVIPLFEQVRPIDTRVVTVDIPRQEAITMDNVPVMIDAVVFMRVVRPDQAVINVQDYMFAIVQYGRSALRDVIGGRTLDEVLTDREGISKQIGDMLTAETVHWGMEVDGIRMQDIVLPEDLKKVMSRQAGAEREKRANITKSEGDRIAAENLAAAAQTMMASPGAMQLRSLQTIDGLGPTASNTVVLAVPIEVMEAVDAIAQSRRKNLPAN